MKLCLLNSFHICGALRTECQRLAGRELGGRTGSGWYEWYVLERGWLLSTCLASTLLAPMLLSMLPHVGAELIFGSPRAAAAAAPRLTGASTLAIVAFPVIGHAAFEHTGGELIPWLVHSVGWA